MKKSNNKLRPTYEDYLRGVGYLMFVVWPIALLIFPPVNFFSAFGPSLTPRIIWLGVTALGAVAATIGAFRRYDIKVELPGILLMHLGPILFSFSNWWYVAFPDELNPDPANRVALAIFALIPTVLLLPRTVTLMLESRRLHRVGKQQIETARQLLEAGRTREEENAK